MLKRFLILITLSVAVFSEIVASQSASAMDSNTESRWDNFPFKGENGEGDYVYCTLEDGICGHKSLPATLYEKWSPSTLCVKLDVGINCLKYRYNKYQELNEAFRRWAFKHVIWILFDDDKHYKEFQNYSLNEKKKFVQEHKYCLKFLAHAFKHILNNSKLPYEVLIKTNEFLKTEPELLKKLYLDIIKFPNDQHEIVHRTFMTPLISPAKYELFFEISIPTISCKKKNFADDTFEDSELESSNTTEALTQSNSSNSQESFKDRITPLFKNKGGCNNALNTEASSEENRSIFLKYNSIIYREGKPEKGSVKKLSIRESHQQQNSSNSELEEGRKRPLTVNDLQSIYLLNNYGRANVLHDVVGRLKSYDNSELEEDMERPLTVNDLKLIYLLNNNGAANVLHDAVGKLKSYDNSGERLMSGVSSLLCGKFPKLTLNDHDLYTDVYEYQASKTLDFYTVKRKLKFQAWLRHLKEASELRQQKGDGEVEFKHELYSEKEYRISINKYLKYNLKKVAKYIQRDLNPNINYIFITKLKTSLSQEWLIELFSDLLRYPPDKHEIAYKTFVAFLKPPSEHELYLSPRVHNITCKNNKIEFSLSSSESFEDSELESNDTTESILFTHYVKKITMPERSEDSNQNTDSTTDLKNSTIKTETTTESSSTLTQSSSSNLQESSNNIMISMPRKLISSHFTFSFEDLEHLQCNCGECNNALNTEVSTSEEKNDDRQVFALSRMLLQAEESFNNDPKSLLRNRGKCNNALNTEASSEENSSVGDTRVFLICDSIIYREDTPKKGSVNKLPPRGLNQKLEEEN